MEKGIQTDTYIVDMLQSVFAGIEPVINKHAGGSEYRDELLDVIKELCDVQPEEIRINDVFKSVEEYQQIVGRV